MAGNARGKRSRLGIPVTVSRRVPQYDKDGKRTGYERKPVLAYITAAANVWTFLDLNNTAEAAGTNPVYGNSINDYTRDSGFAGIAKGEDIAVQGYDGKIQAIPSQGGGKSVRLITGVEIRAGSGKFRTITVSFPSWCSNDNISEGLGELIPDTKRKLTPGANEVRPFFINKSGKRYPIMAKAKAEEDKSLEVAETPAAVQEIATSTRTRSRKNRG